MKIIKRGMLELPKEALEFIDYRKYIYLKKGLQPSYVKNFFIEKDKILIPRNPFKFLENWSGGKFEVEDQTIVNPINRELKTINGFKLRDYQEEPMNKVLELFKKGKNDVILVAGTGFGKEQPYSEPVLTPDGWKQMGDLKVGDFVIGSDGLPKKILGIYEQGEKEVYTVYFTNGAKVRCGLEHFWEVKRKDGKKWQVKTLKELLPLVNKEEYRIRLPKPVKSKKVNLLLIKKLTQQYNYDLKRATEIDYYERIKLLQKIINIDGHHITSTLVEVIISSEQLCKDIVELARSLGIYVLVEEKSNFSCVNLEEKSYHIYLDFKKDYVSIEKIEKENYKEKSRCIYIDSEDHLYITRDYILTHNTATLSWLLTQMKQVTTILVDLTMLADQMYNEISKFSNLDVQIVNGKTIEVKEVNIITTQLLNRRPDILQMLQKVTGQIVLDECFDGETEIFTEKGWIKFKDYTPDIKVAQVYPDTLTFDFVLPEKYIKKYSNNLLKIANKNGFSIMATEKHRQIYYTNQGYKVKNFEDMPKTAKVAVAITPNSKNNENLTKEERLKIAFQADGTFSRGNNKTEDRMVEFHIKKERKVRRLKWLLKDLYYTERKAKVGYKRFYVKQKNNIHFSKFLDEMFTLSDFTQKKAKQFLAEIKFWDGYWKQKERNLIYYSSIEKRNADFVAAVAVIAGYYVYQAIQKDDRKDTFRDVHRVYITTDKKFKTLINSDKQKIEHNDFVYCVSVPTTFIFVRQNGRPFVTGNCHISGAETIKSILQSFPARYRLGLSATPTRSDGLDGILEDVFTYKVKTKVTNMKVEVHMVEDYENLISASSYRKAIDNTIKRKYIPFLDLIVDKLVGVKKKSIMIAVDSKEIQEMIAERYKKYGVGILNSNTTKEERERILKEYENENIKILVGYKVLSKGISIPRMEILINLFAATTKENIEQLVGRLMREHPKKKKAIFIDFTFGLSLQKQYNVKINTYNKLQKENKVILKKISLNSYKQLLQKIK